MGSILKLVHCGASPTFTTGDLTSVNSALKAGRVDQQSIRWTIDQFSQLTIGSFGETSNSQPSYNFFGVRLLFRLRFETPGSIFAGETCQYVSKRHEVKSSTWNDNN